MSKKLSEYNASHKTDNETNSQVSVHFISPEYMEILNEITRFPEKIRKNPDSLCQAWNHCIKPVLLTWPKDQLFPILDVLRWQLGQKDLVGLDTCVVTDILNTILLSENKFLSSETSETSVRLTLRVMANIFLQPTLHKTLLKQREAIVGALNSLIEEIESFQGHDNNKESGNIKGNIYP